jgi:hypothetical protein
VSRALEIVSEIEALGGCLSLDGDDAIRYRVPEDAAHFLNELRTQKDEALLLLRKRKEIPSVPAGVRLLHWEPKPAPVVLTQSSVVTDVDRFIRMTLMELTAALACKRWQAGHWSVRDLVDRLEQCGVRLETEERGLSINNLPVRPGRGNQ